MEVTRRMRVTLMLVLCMLACCAAPAFACNQTIPDGHGCFDGFVKNWSGAHGYLCYDWDTSCSSPVYTVGEMHDDGNNQRSFEFLMPAGWNWTVGISPPPDVNDWHCTFLGDLCATYYDQQQYIQIYSAPQTTIGSTWTCYQYDSTTNTLYTCG